MKCANCFTHIEDQRKETKCDECKKAIHKSCAIKEEGTYCDTCYIGKSFAEKETEKIPNVIRRSHIELYKKCPYSFYLEVIKEIPSETGVHAQLGIDLHVLFDKYNKHYDYDQDSMLDDFEDIWNKYNKSLFDSEEQKNEMYERATTSISNFYKFITPMQNPPFTSEQTI